MPVLILTTDFQSIGPLASGERWTVRDGELIVSFEAASGNSPDRGQLISRGQSIDFDAGDTIFVRAPTTANLINRDPGLYPADLAINASTGWSYAAPVGGLLNTTTAVTNKEGVANLRNEITAFSLMAEALATASEFAIRDGAGGAVLWRTKIPTTGMPVTHFSLPTPIHASAGNLLEIVTLTASVTGAVYFNAQGAVVL